MQLLSVNALQTYWTGAYLEANLLIGLNLLGALALGMLVGYERSYHGRAAGMRTYGLVCMASTALTVFVGLADYWYGGNAKGATTDPTRVVQGIVTGIGFLCAGVIHRDGLSISGLTSAASMWAAAAIGVLLGVGFYGAALALALLCAVSMTALSRLERLLPAQTTLALTLKFRMGFMPREDVLSRAAAERGYQIQRNTLCICFEDGQPVWKFIAVAQDRSKGVSPAQLAEELVAFDGVVDFAIAPARN